MLGFIGSSLSFILWLPQAKLTWQNRHSAEKLAGISTGTQYVVLANATTWGIYAILTEAWWVGAPGLINFPLALGTILLVRKAQQS